VRYNETTTASAGSMIDAQLSIPRCRTKCSVVIVFFSVVACSTTRPKMLSDPTHTVRTVSVGGLNISYEERGTGQPILFIHGFGASAFVWRGLQDCLHPAYRFISIDLKGFGNSAKPNDGRYSPHDQASLVIDFMSTLELEHVIIVGHSFGGGVALMTVLSQKLAQADIVRALVLLGTPAYPQKLPRVVRALRIPVLGCVIPHLLPPCMSARMALRDVFHRKERITKEMIDAYAYFLNLPGARSALVSTARQISQKDYAALVDRYNEIRIPTLIVWGEHDRLVPIEHGKKLAAAIPKSRFRIIADCGHAPQEERPQETALVMMEFLRSVGAGD